MSAACPSAPLPSRPSAPHPPGFYIVCLTVLCERWAAYLLASSLVFLLGERYGYGRAATLRIAGLINAATYLGTLPGGLVADRLLGSARALRVSLTLLVLGYGALTLWDPAALWVALGLLVAGSALFKPGTQGLMAKLYAASDPRLDSA